ncbi:MAG: DUF6370 family protein [Verrucomicrobiota bacterium]
MQHPLFPRVAGLAGVLLLLAGCATPPPAAITQPTVVEAACGECLFGLPGRDCDLAVRVHGRAYFVDGVPLDSLGDAHAADGMCQVIRKARVTGRVAQGRFVASRFELLPAGR